MSPIYVPGKVVLAKNYTAGDRYFNETSLLLHGEGIAIVDSSRFSRSLTVAGAVTSTTQKKFGDRSIFFDGTNDSVTSAVESVNIRTAPFTMEAWVYPTANLASKDIAIFGAGSNDFYLVTVSNTMYLGDGVTNNVAISNAATLLPANDNWKHVAVSFDGTTYRVFVQGQLAGFSTTLLKNYNLSQINVGYHFGVAGNLFWMDGYLDEVRVTSAARYTANFTPPTAPFVDGYY